jgi:cell division protein FtsL
VSRLEDWAPLKPFLSIVILISTLFALVFVQMEERRMGYELLKLTREQKRLVEERRMKEMQLAKLTRLQQVEKIASRLPLRKVQANQIIHLSGSQPTYASEPERGDLN